MTNIEMNISDDLWKKMKTSSALAPIFKYRRVGVQIILPEWFRLSIDRHIVSDIFKEPRYKVRARLERNSLLELMKIERLVTHLSDALHEAEYTLSYQRLFKEGSDEIEDVGFQPRRNIYDNKKNLSIRNEYFFLKDFSLPVFGAVVARAIVNSGNKATEANAIDSFVDERKAHQDHVNEVVHNILLLFAGHLGLKIILPDGNDWFFDLVNKMFPYLHITQSMMTEAWRASKITPYSFHARLFEKAFEGRPSGRRSWEGGRPQRMGKVNKRMARTK